MLPPRSVRGVRRPRHRRRRARRRGRRAERHRPGAPGAEAFWTPADKQGFGTATTTQSKVWHTLQGGELTEVYYPDLGTPALRDLQLIVTDGSDVHRPRDRRDDPAVELVDKRSLTYRQVNTATAGRYRIVKTYVTDPAAQRVLVDVRFQSLTGRPYQVYAYVDPSLSNDGSDDSGDAAHGALRPRTATRPARSSPSRPSAAPPPATWTPATAGSTCATTTGWTGSTAPRRTATSSRPRDEARRPPPASTCSSRWASAHRRAPRRAAPRARRCSAASARVAAAYADGWHRYLGSLKRAPASAKPRRRRVRRLGHGPGRPRGQDQPRRLHRLAARCRGRGAPGSRAQSGVYHAVWSRDLYQIATALLAAGDRGAAERALTFLFDKQQRPDGSFPQNTFVDGTPHWDGTSAGRGRLPDRPRLAARPRRRATYTQHVKPAADWLVAHRARRPTGPLGEPGRLVAGHDRLGDRRPRLRRRPRARERRRRERGDLRADRRRLAAERRGLDGDHQRPVLRQALLPARDQGRPTPTTAPPTRSATAARAASTSARSSTRASSSSCGSASSAPTTRRSSTRSRVVDQQLAVDTPNGRFWHRANFDGYGEQLDGAPWDSASAGPHSPRHGTIGRAWPIFAGERGEYELARRAAGAPPSWRRWPAPPTRAA